MIGPFCRVRDLNSRVPPRNRDPNPSDPDTLEPRDLQDGRSGLRRRPQRDPHMATPAPLVPRIYPNPTRNEDSETQGTPQAQGCRNRSPRARTLADPATENPSYLRPQDETPSVAADSGAPTLGSARSERGEGRSLPSTRPSGLRAVAERVPQSGVTEIRGDGSVVGLVATHVDDMSYVGLPVAAPALNEETPFLEVEELGAEVERHTSEEDGVGRSPLITDQEDPAVVPEQRADVEAQHHADGQGFPRLSIYPGWVLRTPPREFWPAQPDWGGWEALWHQSVPTHVTRDVYFWSQDRGVLLRVHAAPRRRLYVPAESTLPVGLTRADLTGRRRTFIRFRNPVQLLIEEDRLSDPRPQRQLARSWTGRTEFEVRREPRAG